MSVKALVLQEARRSMITSLIQKPIRFVKNLKTVTVSIHYTTKSEPDVTRGKDFTFDVERMTTFFQKGERDMAAYQYKIIWINEMGEEQVAYVETREDRDTKIQALADDGYSPVWRNV